MTRIIAAALIAAGMAAPAIAQDYEVVEETTTYDVAAPDHGYCDNARARQLNWQIRREARQDDIDRSTARDLREQVADTAALERNYCATGMTASRADDLDRQYARIERDLRDESLG